MKINHVINMLIGDVLTVIGIHLVGLWILWISAVDIVRGNPPVIYVTVMCGIISLFAIISRRID
jgi:hypothetical protein